MIIKRGISTQKICDITAFIRFCNDPGVRKMVAADWTFQAFPILSFWTYMLNVNVNVE